MATNRRIVKRVGRLVGVLTGVLVVLSTAAAFGQGKPVRVPGAEAEKLLIKPAVRPLRPAFRGTGFPAHLEFTVLPNGSVTDIVDLDHNPVGPPGPSTAAGVSAKGAMDAVAQWKFHPYLRDGLPAAMRVKILMEYKGDWQTTFQ